MHWLHTQLALLDTARAVVSFAANWLLQSTLLIAAGLAVAWWLGRRGSALQSAIYRTTLAAVIVCPLATALLARGGVSGWSVELPVAWTYEEETPPLADGDARQAVASPSSPAAENAASLEPVPLSTSPAPSTDFGPETSGETFFDAQASVGLGGQFPPNKAPVASTQTFRAKRALFEVRAFGLAAIGISLTWLAVSAMLLWRLARAWRRLGQLRRAAVTAEPAAQRACRELSALLAVAAPEVRRTPYLASPCLAGLLRPVVLLPEAEASLPLRDVLIHELAHLRRRDGWWNLLTRLAEALFFYQPLLWTLARRLDSAAEEVCDDYVVQLGGNREGYARGLLEIAELSLAPVGAAGVAMVSLRSILARRVTRIVDSSRSLSTRAGNLLVALVIVGGLVGATAAGLVGLGPRPSLADPQPTSDAVVDKANAQAGKADDADLAPDGAARTALRGIALDSAGKPLPGAAVYLRLAVSDADDAPLESTMTDDAGRFEFSFRWPQSDERIGRKPDLLVVATADGLAPDWKYLRKDQPLGDITLNLPEETAITGRIVNGEGRPLAGVEVRVETILRYDSDTMNLMRDDVAQGRSLMRMGKDWQYGALPKQPARVATAADGRFRIAGLSANEVVRLRVRGAGIRESRLNATTAVRDTIRGPVPPVEPPYGPQAGAVLYGSEFDYVAEPGRRIEGTVLDRETRRPVAKAKVMIYQPSTAFPGGNDRLLAETDDAGRYAIDGCAKTSRLVLNADPPADGPAHFPAALPIGDSPGLANVVQDVELVRGIELRGRIVDSETAQPLIADVHYAPLYLNKHAEPLYEQQANLHSHARSDVDGSFHIAVAPGPGAVAVSTPTSASEDYTSVGVSYEDVVKLFEESPTHRELAHSPELKQGLPDALPTQEHGGWSLFSQTGQARVMLICPEGQKPPEPIELRLVRGRRIEGKLLDPAGEPLTGATAFLGNPGIVWQHLPAAEFTVTALAAGEKRDIAFQDEQRKLGAFRSVTADDAALLVVRLEPCGVAIGRVLDEEGAPLAGKHVWFYPAGKRSTSEVFSITDADGRFRNDELIPDQPYELIRTGPGSRSRLQFTRDKRVFKVGSAQTRDLGDLVYGGAVNSEKEPARDTDRKSQSLSKTVEQVPAVRLLDVAGKAVVGAWVGVGAYGDSESAPVWSPYSPKGVSDDAGRAEISGRELRDGRVVLYARDEARNLAALSAFSREELLNMPEMVLRPACRVSGKLTSAGLADAGHKLEWTNVYLCHGDDRPLEFMSKLQRFEFYLPPGEYRLIAYGTDTLTVERDIVVAENQRELDAGAIDLPATKLATLVAKPAPELRDLQGWKNSPETSLAALRGKYVLLDFWGHWCGPCIRGMPHLMKLHDAFGDRGLAVVAVHDASVESIAEMDRKLAKAREREWFGRDIPFPVALDGGSPPDGVDPKTWHGATTEAYGIDRFPTTLLIDPEGKIVKKVEARDADLPDELARLLGVSGQPPTWQRRFDEVYQLPPGEVLRHISPPFIRERTNFLTELNFGSGSWPAKLTVLWDGATTVGNVIYDDDDLLSVLVSLIGYQRKHLLDCPPELARRKVPGDWVVDADAPLAKRLGALETMLRQELQLKVRIRQKKVEREVVAVSGSYRFVPLRSGDAYIHFATGDRDLDDVCGGGEGQIADLVEWSGGLSGVPFVNEIESPPEAKIQWDQHPSTVLFKPFPTKELDQILGNLARQTSLKFERRRAMVDIWTIREEE